MSTNLMTAATQYATRPADERFASPALMLRSAQEDKSASREATYNLKDLKVLPTDNRVVLASPKGSADFTHWSFGQLCKTLKAPANYLRSLPPTVAADAMNFGLRSSEPGTVANILVRAPKAGEMLPVVRAATSESYARVWDADLYGQLHSALLDRDSRWMTPPTWDGAPAGAYRGDRDSFLIVVNGGSIVTDPSLMHARGGSAGVDGASMFRGLMIRNSEVGGGAVSIDHVLFRYICGNHIIWGATFDRRFRRRHVGHNTNRDVVKEILRAAALVGQQSPERDEAIIRALISKELATTKEGVIDELRSLGFTKEDATNAYEACETFEAASPRSFWGLAQGATRVSQESGFQDERLSMDRLASLVLARGAKLVTV